MAYDTSQREIMRAERDLSEIRMNDIADDCDRKKVRKLLKKRKESGEVLL